MQLVLDQIGSGISCTVLIQYFFPLRPWMCVCLHVSSVKKEAACCFTHCLQQWNTLSGSCSASWRGQSDQTGGRIFQSTACGLVETKSRIEVLQSAEQKKKKEERGEKVWRRRANSEVKWGQNGWTLRDGREADGGFPQRCRDRKPTCWMGIMYHNHNIYSLRLRPLYQDTFVHHLELEHIHKKDIARTVAESLLVLFLSIQSLGTLQQQTLNILFTHTCRKIPNPLLTFVHLISCSDLIV